MKLINVHDLGLEESFDASRPEYAILSHRWGDDEVTYQEMLELQSTTRRKAGFKKIEACCRQAKLAGLDYAWVDTCCIDKRSSAELSESINSMYRWYQDSSVCFVHLSDVLVNCSDWAQWLLDTSSDLDPMTLDVSDIEFLVGSAWFTRGWTLQELIAPNRVLFFDEDWQQLGTKSLLSTLLSKVTGIEKSYITGESHIRTASAAKRMSWASKRETSRTEDMAYCLMGLFGVNMPMLYGEGDRAFIRLQEEILKTSNDHSIFAWSSPRMTRQRAPGLCFTSMTGLLASHPRDFTHSGNFVPFSGLEEDSLLVTSTNMGISLQVYLIPKQTWNEDDNIVRVSINCHESDRLEHFAIMELYAVNKMRNLYLRADPTVLYRGKINGVTQRIYVSHDYQAHLLTPYRQEGWFGVEVMPSEFISWQLEVHPGTRWRISDIKSGVPGKARALLSPRLFDQDEFCEHEYCYPLYADTPAVTLYGVGKMKKRLYIDKFKLDVGVTDDNLLAVRLAEKGGATWTNLEPHWADPLQYEIREGTVLPYKLVVERGPYENRYNDSSHFFLVKLKISK